MERSTLSFYPAVIWFAVVIVRRPSGSVQYAARLCAVQYEYSYPEWKLRYNYRNEIDMKQDDRITHKLKMLLLKQGDFMGSIFTLILSP